MHHRVRMSASVSAVALALLTGIARVLALAFHQPFRDGDVARFDKVLSRHRVDEPLNPG